MKKQYLLFDSGCSLCTSLARQVEEVSDGKLIARSLRDPEIRSILDAEKPGWSWEPMLLEMDDEGRQLYTGVSMRLHLARVLGPRRALEMARIVQKATAFQPARRGVLKLAGGLMASLALGGWASKSVKAGDGLEAGATQKVFLPFLQSVVDRQAVEAEKAVQLMFGSKKFADLMHQNQQGDVEIDMAPKRLERVVVQGAEFYAYGNRAAAFAGETEGHRLYQVFLGTENPNPDREQVLLVGLVDTQQEEVVEVFKFNIAPEPVTMTGHADDYRVAMQTSNGDRLEIVTQGGQVNPDKLREIVAANRSGLAGINNPLSTTGCNDSCVCSLVCGSIPIWYCAVIGYLTGGVGGAVCGVVFLLTCSWICQ